MPYIVKGLHRETGEPKSLRYAVSSEKDAVQRAGDAGYVVESIQYVCDAPDVLDAISFAEEYAATAAAVERGRRARRATEGRNEPNDEPVNGLVLVAIAIGIAMISGLVVANAKDAIGVGWGYVGLGVASMIYLAGVIRWAVSGVQLVQLDRLQRQNNEIIDLLEIIADKKDHRESLEKIRGLRNSGKLSDAQFRENRRELLREE